MNWIKTYENFSKIKEEKKKHDESSRTERRGQPTLHLVRSIISRVRDGYELNERDISLLDEISEYKDLYQITKKWVQSMFDVFKSYNFEELEDRLWVELYEDELCPMMMLSLSKKNSSIGIQNNKLNDPKYLFEVTGQILQNVLYECAFNEKITIDKYFKIVRPALHIEFIWGDTKNRKKYNLIHLEKLADRIVNRFKQLFNVKNVEFNDYPREGRRYDTNIDVYDYGFIIYLN